MVTALCLKLHQENQCHEGIEWRCNRMMKCYLCFGGRGTNFVDKCVGEGMDRVVT